MAMETLQRKYQELLRQYPPPIKQRPKCYSDPPLFLRERPHPRFVNHFLGLCDERICKVRKARDFGKFQNTSYKNELHLPRLNTSQDTLKTSATSPVNFRSIPVRLKALPGVGMMPAPEPWRRELRALTEAVMQPIMEDINGIEARYFIGGFHGYPILRPATSPYMLGSNQMNPFLRNRPCTSDNDCNKMSRSVCRPDSRPHSTIKLKVPKFPNCDFVKQYAEENIENKNDYEGEVFRILWQLLQPKSVECMKSWLACASDRDKATVYHLIQKVMVYQCKGETQEDTPRTAEEKHQEEKISQPEPVAFEASKQEAEQRSSTYDRLILSDLKQRSKTASSRYSIRPQSLASQASLKSGRLTTFSNRSKLSSVLKDHSNSDFLETNIPIEAY